jgi:hypothetical protein
MLPAHSRSVLVGRFPHPPSSNWGLGKTARTHRRHWQNGHFGSLKSLARRVQHANLRLNMCKAEDLFHHAGRARRRVRLQPVVRIMPGLDIQENRFPFGEIVYDNQRDLAALRQRFPAGHAKGFVADQQIELLTFEAQGIQIPNAVDACSIGLAFHAGDAEDVVELAAAQVASVFIHRRRTVIRHQHSAGVDEIPSSTTLRNKS